MKPDFRSSVTSSETFMSFPSKQLLRIFKTLVFFVDFLNYANDLVYHFHHPFIFSSDILITRLETRLGSFKQVGVYLLLTLSFASFLFINQLVCPILCLCFLVAEFHHMYNVYHYFLFDIIIIFLSIRLVSKRDREPDERPDQRFGGPRRWRQQRPKSGRAGGCRHVLLF